MSGGGDGYGIKQYSALWIKLAYVMINCFFPKAYVLLLIQKILLWKLILTEWRLTFLINITATIPLSVIRWEVVKLRLFLRFHQESE